MLEEMLRREAKREVSERKKVKASSVEVIVRVYYCLNVAVESLEKWLNEFVIWVSKYCELIL